jgi:hypothetical protein
MKVTHSIIARGFASHAHDGLRKLASAKTARFRRRWLEDAELIKLCKLFKHQQKQK